jgi:hypothetical protein
MIAAPPTAFAVKALVEGGEVIEPFARTDSWGVLRSTIWSIRKNPGKL